VHAKRSVSGNVLYKRYMKFAIDHVFPRISADDFAALYFDEPFNEALSQALSLGRTLLRLDRSADRVVRQVVFEPARAADAAVNQAYGGSRASFVEELVYDVRARRGEWRTIPWLLPDRVKTRGTIEIAAVPGGIKRIVRGEVDARLWGFGALVERRAVAEIEKTYAQAAIFTNAWLARAR